MRQQTGNFRTVFVRLVICLGALRVFRKLANILQLRRNHDDAPVFPFFKRRQTRKAQILGYHRVNDDADAFFPGVPVALFTRQMEYVAENYTIYSLDQIVAALTSRDLPDNALCITFDDGYKDNFVHAFPVLSRLSLPATIFLATGAIGSGKLLWHDRVFAGFRQTQVPELAVVGTAWPHYPLQTVTQRQYALAAVLNSLWNLPDIKRGEYVNTLLDALEVENDAQSQGLMLDWPDVETMSECNIQFGAHTVTHPILSKAAPQLARKEIGRSTEAIEQRRAVTVNHFAYPVGRRSDFSDEIKTFLRDVGFVSAVTTIDGSNDEHTDLYELRRATPWDADVDSFALRLAYFKFAS